MSPETIATVRASWEAVTPYRETIPRALHAQLSANDPAVAALLGGMDQHQASLIHLLDTIVDALDDAESLVAISGSLGRRNAAYRIDQRQLDHVREALIDTLAHVLGTGFTAERRRAWAEASTLVISLILRAMRHGRASENEHLHISQ
jgi:hemoglobin-like flavoprotein